MNSSNILDNIPEELWVSILSEWIGKDKALGAFDAALCNKLLRDRYLWWLQQSSLIYAKLLFDTTRCPMNFSRCVPGGFLYWCDRRKIRPKLMSMATTAKSCKEVFEKDCWRVLQDVELLKYKSSSKKLLYAMLNLLDRFPKLMDLEIYGPLVVDFPSLSSACALVRLEIHDSDFSFYNFETFVQMCPALQVVKIHNSSGIYLHNLQYLIGHAANLQILHCDVYEIDEEKDSIAQSRQNATKGNPSLRCLHLGLFIAESENCSMKVCVVSSSNVQT